MAFKETCRVGLFGSLDGIGGLTLTFQIAKALKEVGTHSQIWISANDKILEAIEYLYGGGTDFFVNAVPPDVQENDSLYQKLKQSYGETYFVYPDGTFSNKDAFDFQKYNLSLQTILQQRTLLPLRRDCKKVVLALNSNTAGYSYPCIGELAQRLGRTFEALLPEYSVILPVLDSWGDKPVPYINIPSDMPKNVIIKKNPSMKESLKDLKDASYCICADNGFSHLAFQLGVPRLLLDPRLDFSSSAWQIRWREDLNDSVDISTNIDTIIYITHMNLKVLQTQLLPRRTIANKIDISTDIMKQILMIKEC